MGKNHTTHIIVDPNGKRKVPPKDNYQFLVTVFMFLGWEALGQINISIESCYVPARGLLGRWLGDLLGNVKGLVYRI